MGGNVGASVLDGGARVGVNVGSGVKEGGISVGAGVSVGTSVGIGISVGVDVGVAIPQDVRRVLELDTPMLKIHVGPHPSSQPT